MIDQPFRSKDSMEPESDEESSHLDSFSVDDNATQPSLPETQPNDIDEIAQRERNTLVREETKAVMYVRIMVFFILVVTALSLSFGVYFASRFDESKTARNQFDIQSDKIMIEVRTSLEDTLKAMDAMSTATTTFATASSQPFPNVTIPDFVFNGGGSRLLSQALNVFWSPLVSNESLSEWEAFSSEMGANMSREAFALEYEAWAYQNEKYGLSMNISEVSKAIESVHTDIDQPPFEEGVWRRGDEGQIEYYKSSLEPEIPQDTYFPLWQVSPALPSASLLNVNLFDVPSFHQAMKSTLHKTVASIGSFIHTDRQSDQNEDTTNEVESQDIMEDLTDAFVLMGQYRNETKSYMNEPLSPLFYPVFDKPSTGSPSSDRVVVGMLGMQFYWKSVLSDILVEGMNGVICVLTNSDGDSITYRLDGPEVVYLGEGDLHDPGYDFLRVESKLGEMMSANEGLTTRSYGSVDLDEVMNEFTIELYPSESFEDGFLSLMPLIFAGLLILAYSFTAFVFFLYDMLVDHRQRIIMDRAVKSSAVVSSLFPATVRERVLEGLEENKGEGSGGKKKVGFKILGNVDRNTPKTYSSVEDISLEKFRSNSGRSLLRDDMSYQSLLSFEQALSGHVRKGNPIADRFPEATVFFADIAGFTSWSASREPDQVFKLLETLYGAFDKVALRRRVFKVETIGDCYMAVTGVPEAQPDHAIRMARFAMECLTKMKKLVTNQLADTLGQDTADLSFRVGMHSGQVTAGVLRGERARFQLFGDTVNTASRMESNGMKGRIHCSESTAIRLVEAGKQHWLTKRTNLIEAKGKGKMQTYWVSGGNNRRNPDRIHSMSSGSVDSDEDLAITIDVPMSIYDPTYSPYVNPVINSSIKNAPMIDLDTTKKTNNQGDQLGHSKLGIHDVTFSPMLDNKIAEESRELEEKLAMIAYDNEDVSDSYDDDVMKEDETPGHTSIGNETSEATSSSSSSSNSSMPSKSFVTSSQSSFDSCSVGIGEIVGFNQWSVGKDPVQVSVFLETIFEELDCLSKTLGIVKLETTGHRFVVTLGTEDGCDNHGFQVLQLGIQWNQKLQELIPALIATYGEKYTSSLSFRMGVHSGTSIGTKIDSGASLEDICNYTSRGLSNEKLRNFGPNVETACQLQINGPEGFVHCSQATLDLLKTSDVTREGFRVQPYATGNMEGIVTYLISHQSNAVDQQENPQTEIKWLSV